MIDETLKEIDHFCDFACEPSFEVKAMKFAGADNHGFTHCVHVNDHLMKLVEVHKCKMLDICRAPAIGRAHV